MDYFINKFFYCHCERLKGAKPRHGGASSPLGLLAMTFLFLTVAGCTSMYNPATERNEFIAISTPQEVAMGNDVQRGLAKEYKFSTDKAKLDRFERIADKLAQVSDRQDYVYHFYLVEKDEMNAFTTPGGNVYFFTGLFDKLKTDDQIASVLAHEIGHCAARHTAKKFQAALGYSLVGNIVFSVLAIEDQTKRVAALGTDMLMNVVFSAYSRGDELQADKLGLKYMYLAGYDLKGMIETFQILDQGSKGPDVPLILRSHPYIHDRIEQAKKEMEIVKSKYGS